MKSATAPTSTAEPAPTPAESRRGQEPTHPTSAPTPAPRHATTTMLTVSSISVTFNSVAHAMPSPAVGRFSDALRAAHLAVTKAAVLSDLPLVGAPKLGCAHRALQDWG